MDKSLERIIAAHLEEKEASEKESMDNRTPSRYDVPYSQLMDHLPYYTEQEVTDVNLQLNSPSNDQVDEKHFDKMLVYPEQDWSNADWAGGNFLEPSINEIQREFNRTDNDAINLYDPHKGASIHDISDLSLRMAGAIDNFLDTNNFVKVSSMDLEQFLKVSDDTLVHKSNKDIWKMVQDKEGNIYISRLFDEEVLEDK